MGGTGLAVARREARLRDGAGAVVGVVIVHAGERFLLQCGGIHHATAVVEAGVGRQGVHRRRSLTDRHLDVRTIALYLIGVVGHLLITVDLGAVGGAANG